MSGAVQARTEPGSSIYVHVPFCDVRCPYCHFYCFVNQDEALPMRTVQALRREFALRRPALRELGSVHSVYFGGGTPTALPADARRALCAWLAEEVAPLLEPGAEITLEANPESARAEVLADWVAAGVNRLSLGIQSMDAQRLRFLGRLNTPESNHAALTLACSMVENVSVDLILGVPESTWPSVEADLTAVSGYPIRHLSGYLLEIHAATRFGRDVAAGRFAPQPDATQCDIYLRASTWLSQRGFQPYELSNFGKPGYESRHNGRYWRRLPYIGLGPSAHSFCAEQRWENHRDARRWCDDLERDVPPVGAVECLDAEQRRLEQLLLGLRTREGVAAQLLAGQAALVDTLAREGLLRREADRVVATARGWLLLDPLVERLTSGEWPSGTPAVAQA